LPWGVFPGTRSTITSWPGACHRLAFLFGDLNALVLGWRAFLISRQHDPASLRLAEKLAGASAKRFCSEHCRKAAQNRRLGYVRRDEATYVPAGKKSLNYIDENQQLKEPFRRDESFLWTACNEVTRKLTRGGSTAIGWAMLVLRSPTRARKGHFIRISCAAIGRRWRQSR
jgi:hypothetical protein